MMTKKIPKLSKFWSGAKVPIAVAHRGGDAAGIDKENSLKAFKAAYKSGYRWFETDIVATRDRKLIAIHGRGFQLRPNRDLPSRTRLRRLTYAEIKKNIKIGGEAVPLFEQLLDEFPDAKIFVDPKTFGTVKLLIDTLSNRPKDIDRISIGAFSKMRTIKTAYLIKKNTGKEVCTAILGPINAYPVYLAARFKTLRPFAKFYIEEIKASSIRVPYRWITNSPKAGRKFVEYAHELGLMVGVYTPNSHKSIKSCLDEGADVIMSDKAKLLIDLVSAKHKK